MPDFVIIGAQRCGTTSLYNYLAQHPNVAPAFVKETHFFDSHYRRGRSWYRAYFPLGRLSAAASRARAVGSSSRGASKPARITGEATPYYLFYPHAAERVKAIIPAAKLIVLLRNPVDRAYSHYHHEVSTGAITGTFEDALRREEEILPAETVRVEADSLYRSFGHVHYSFVARGLYVDQLRKWAQFFGKEQTLVLRSEDLYADPGAMFARVCEFLTLPHWSPSRYEKYNLAQYSDLASGTRQRLVSCFAPHNLRLAEYLGVDLDWDN